MLQALRWQLILWFIGLSMLLYSVLSAAAVTLFDQGLEQLTVQELRGLAREIRPDIEYMEEKPSLHRWARLASAREIQVLATIQLYDNSGHLLEEYGPAGVPVLRSGVINAASPVHSWNRKLEEHGEPRGFVQLQISTRQKENAIKQLVYTLLLLAPVLLLGLGVIGYIFAGKALKPTENSLEALRRFVADAGHELNTPITIIQASVETLQKRDGESADFLSAINRATDRLSDLGRKLMLLARLEGSELTCSQTFDLDALVRLICEDLSPAFQREGIHFYYGDLIPIQTVADPEAISTMVSNLIQNALQYTECGGMVRVTLAEKGRTIVLTVEDSGIGIPAECLAKIFDRFYRIDKSRSRSVGGSGLGLAIVKAIAEAHRGQVRVESVPGKGSKFAVQIPIRER